MRAVDTNVLVRLVTRDDPGQVAAAEAFVTDGAWASHVVIAEAAWAFTYRYGMPRDEVARAIELILGSPVAVQEPAVVDAALRRFRESRRVGFADCLIVEIAAHAGHAPLGSFDRDLARLDGTEGL